MHPALLIGLALAAATFPVDGVVLAVDPASRTMLVSHRPIPKYMDAMVMPFHVKDARELEGVLPGARVQFELAVARDGATARRVRVTGQSELPASKGRIAIG